MRRIAVAVAMTAAVACSPNKDAAVTDTTGTTAAASANTSNDRAAIDSVRSAWVAGAEKKDAAAVAGLYTDDAVLTFANTPEAKGKDAVQKTLGEGFPVVSNLKVNSEQLDVNGDLAVDRGTYSEHVAPPNAKAMDVAGRYIVVMKKTAGGWKIANHMGWVPPAK